MEWVLQFSPDNTNGQTFYLDNGDTMTAAMMSRFEVTNQSIGYCLDDNITVPTMNLKEYNNTQLEFVAIKPTQNLSDFVKNVSKVQISEIDSKNKSANNTLDGVNVKIPKFKFDHEISLKRDLMQLE